MSRWRGFASWLRSPPPTAPRSRARSSPWTPSRPSWAPILIGASLRSSAHASPTSARSHRGCRFRPPLNDKRSEEHTSELQSPCNLVCRLLLEKKKEREHRTQPTLRQRRFRGYQPPASREQRVAPILSLLAPGTARLGRTGVIPAFALATVLAR